MAVDVAALIETATKIIYTVGGLIVAGGLAWFVWRVKKYNRTIDIYDLTSGTLIVRSDKAREVIDEKNILCWRLSKEKITQSCPPKEAVSIKKGKKHAVLVRIQGDQYHWLNLSDFKKDAVNVGGKFFVIPEDAKRQFADQIKKSQEERTTALNSLMQKVAPIAVIGILFIGAYFMWDVIGSKNAEVAQALAGVAASQAKIAEQNAEAMKLVVEVLARDNVSLNPTQNIPAVPKKGVPN